MTILPAAPDEATRVITTLEAKDAKAELENEIEDAITRFQWKTGCFVHRVDIAKRNDLHPSLDEAQVSVEARL